MAAAFPPRLSACLQAIFALALSIAAARPVLADPIISEFMASNTTTLADVDGDFSDWIEIFNPDSTAANLNGWFLADKATDKTKFKLPAITIAPGGYLVVFASNKNRKDPTQQIHTNFGLSASGGYLALVKPDGVTATTEFLAYPPQVTDISYGVTQPTDASPPRNGFLRVPSPGARNPDLIMLPDAVTFSRAPGLFTGTFALSLTGAVAGETILYTITPPSAAGPAVPEPTATSTPYTGPITVNSSVVVRAEIFSTDNKSRGLPATAQFVKLADATASFSTNLPVIVLDSHGGGPLNKDGIYHPAWLYAFTPPATGPTTLTGTPALATPAGMTVHGNFSQVFPKKSWDLTLQDTRGYDNDQPLLGLDVDHQWELYGPWSTDRSYIRNAYVYALSNRIGRWAPRTRFVETFVNNDNDGLTTADYYGIGVLIDRLKVSPARININSIGSTDLTAPAVTGGYIFKMDPTPDLTHYNFVTDHGIPSQNPAQGATGFIVESPDGGTLKPAQATYVRSYIQSMENSLFTARAGNYGARGYLDYIDLPSWVDHHLMKLFFGDVDALYHSDYFYKDLNGKLVSGPVWDFDGSMNDGDPRNANPNTWDTAGGRPLWDYDWWGQITHDPEFMQAWIDRWQSLRRNEFSTANLTGLADSLAAQIPADAAARDAARWPDTGTGGNTPRSGGSFLSEIAIIKDWITARSAWIDSQWVATPTMTVSGANVTFTAPAGAQLAYTLDGSDPRALGGVVPSYTTLTSDPLTVAATANIHVRSYNASLLNVFPGSPWSSAIGGPNSTAILLRPRLSNLSVLTNLALGDNFQMGFIVGGSGTGGSKPLLARAAGPSLAQFGVPNPNAAPRLDFYTGSVNTDSNKSWGGDPVIASAMAQVGAFPFVSDTSKDSAVFEPAVAAGSNSVIISGNSTSSGAVLAEVYDATATANLTASSPRLINVSVLKGLGDGLTVGFVIAPAGGAAKNVLIRAVGPTLGAPPFNVPGVVADPQLTLYDATNKVIGQNDNWGGTPTLTAVFSTVGAFALPANSLDAALVATLTPGNYTVQVKGAGTTTGIALVEVYELP